MAAETKLTTQSVTADDMSLSNVVFSDRRSVLCAAVDLAIAAVETAWSPLVFDMLVDLFGVECWRQTCQNVLLREGSNSGNFLPSRREDRFDLNTMMTVLNRLQRFSDDTAQSARGASVLALADAFSTCESESEAEKVPALTSKELSTWTQTLTSTVFAFRQRWTHRNDTVSSLECLDALLAMKELSVALLRDRVPSPTQCSVEARSGVTVSALPDHLKSSLEIVAELCRQDGTGGDGSLCSCRSAVYICSHHDALRMLCSQLAHVMSGSLRMMQREICPGPEGAENQHDWPDMLHVLQSSSQSQNVKRSHLPVPGPSQGLGDWLEQKQLHVQAAAGRCQGTLSAARILSALHRMNQVRKIAFHAVEPSLATVRHGVQAARDLVQVIHGLDSFLNAQLQQLEAALQAVRNSKQACISITLNPPPLNSSEQCQALIHTPTQAFIQKPRTKPAFIGRKKELQSLSQHLRPGSLTMISGQPGSGKTATAIELAFNNRHRFPVQLWIDGSSPGLVKLTLRHLTHFYTALTPNKDEPDTQSIPKYLNNSLIVVDGVKYPQQIMPCLPEFLLRSNSVVCTSWCSDAHQWPDPVKPSHIEVLKPFDATHIMALLRSRIRRYSTDSRALAEVLVLDGLFPLLEKQLNKPLDVQLFVSRMKHNDIPRVLKSLCSENAEHRHKLTGVEVGSGDASLLHNDGHDVFLRRTVPLLKWEEKLLLLALSLLCRKVSSLPLSLLVVEQIHAGQPDAFQRDWTLFLTDPAGKWQQRRSMALESLCTHGLVHWCPKSKQIDIDLLLQRHVVRHVPEVFVDGGSCPITLADVSNCLCRVLFQCFKLAYWEGKFFLSTSAAGSDAINMWAFGDSLLSVAVELDKSNAIQLRLWLARMLFTVHLDLERATEHYVTAMDAVSEQPYPCDTATVIQIELGMTLWRFNQASKALSLLEGAKQSLERCSSPGVQDPCLDIQHDKSVLVAKISWELAMAKLCGLSGIPNSSLGLADLPQVSSSIRIGPLCMSDLTASLWPFVRHSLQLAYAGQFVSSCEVLVGKIMEVLEGGINQSIICAMISITQLTIFMICCCDTEDFIHYFDLLCLVEKDLRTFWNSQSMPYICLWKVMIVNYYFYHIPGCISCCPEGCLFNEVDGWTKRKGKYQFTHACS